MHVTDISHHITAYEIHAHAEPLDRVVFTSTTIQRPQSTHVQVGRTWKTPFGRGLVPGPALGACRCGQPGHGRLHAVEQHSNTEDLSGHGVGDGYTAVAEGVEGHNLPESHTKCSICMQVLLCMVFEGCRRCQSP